MANGKFTYIDEELHVLGAVDILHSGFESFERPIGSAYSLALDVRKSSEASAELVEPLLLRFLVRDADGHGHLVARDDAVIQQRFGASARHLGLRALLLALGHSHREPLQLERGHSNPLQHAAVSEITQGSG